MTTYEVLATDQGEAIRCLLCDTTSLDPFDVHEKHCRVCHRYHLAALDSGLHALASAVAILRPDLTLPQQVELAGCLVEHCSPGAHPRIAPSPHWSQGFSDKTN